MQHAGQGARLLRAVTAFAVIGWAQGALAQHQTGFTMIKRCTPNFAYDGATVACQALVQNRDLDHPAVNLSIANALTTPGPSTTEQPVCNKDLAVGLQKFDPTTLNFVGDDAMICDFGETIRVATCAPGMGANFVDDTVSLNGSDGDTLPPAQNGHQGEPVSASASNRVFIACCGDGILDPNSPETCDGASFPANAPATHGACRPQTDAFKCTFCGDGVVQNGETCDDGNADNTDGCRNDCTQPVCGDGILDAGEQCDGNAFPASAPATHGACRPAGGANACTFCGDGTTQAGEACDDGNAVDADACRNNCSLPVCGDGVLDAGETCDGAAFPANAPANHGPCRPAGGANACTFCGDGASQAGEACDDGNAVDTDACRNNCTQPTCGDGILDAGEACDGNIFAANAPATHGPCRPAGGANACTFCGDAVVQAGESCDDGNAVDSDACKNNCTAIICGNGAIDAGETCDGNAFPANAPATHGPCRAPGSAGACTFCGDGALNNGETCDDGNDVDGDSCNNACAGFCPPFVLLLKESGALNNESQVCGSFGVNDVGGNASIGRGALVTDTLAADTVALKNGARANRVETNHLILGKGTSIGSQGPVTLPLAAPFCPIPALTCGGPDVVVAKAANDTLAPGTYGALILANAASLQLTPGGTYNFCSVRVGRNATLQIDPAGGTVINIRDTLSLLNQAYVGPTSGAALPTINVGGTGLLRVAAQAILAGFVSAPNAELRFGRAAEVHGSICALNIPASDKGALVICPGPEGRVRQKTCP